jgi:nitric oxide reductase NorD protein
VTVRTVKSFDERDRNRVARRIGALEPEHFTRMGAAIRHATARLIERPARHRLLLVLSDGRPNDVDLYEGRYGVEDARRAVAEARLLSVHPFCITVDRGAPAYLPRIFGAGAFAVLREPRQLPGALVEVVKGLVGGK